MNTFNVLDTLPNGATILALHTVGHYTFVLCYYMNQYVTWRLNTETGEAFWGNYHRSIVEAALDFRGRIQGIEEMQ